MNRFQSFWYLIKQLGDNISRKKSALFPNDKIIGGMSYSSKPITLPKDAVYLGGVGDGAWFTITEAENANQFIIKRFTSSGKLEYVVRGESTAPIDLATPWQIVYDSHLLFTHLEQSDKKIRINHLERLENDKYDFENIKERYAYLYNVQSIVPLPLEAKNTLAFENGLLP